MVAKHRCSVAWTPRARTEKRNRRNVMILSDFSEKSDQLFISFIRVVVVHVAATLQEGRKQSKHDKNDSVYHH